MEIKELRQQSGMTRSQFVEYFGIPYRTIQDWELGNRKCPEHLLELMEYKLKHEGIIK
jgi:DNA-binding transcriptional regulator YiaG